MVSTAHIARLGALLPRLSPALDGVRDILAAAFGPDGALGLADYFRLLKAIAEAAGEETFELSARPLLA